MNDRRLWAIMAVIVVAVWLLGTWVTKYSLEQMNKEKTIESSEAEKLALDAIRYENQKKRPHAMRTWEDLKNYAKQQGVADALADGPPGVEQHA